MEQKIIAAYEDEIRVRQTTIDYYHSKKKGASDREVRELTDSIWIENIKLSAIKDFANDLLSDIGSPKRV